MQAVFALIDKKQYDFIQFFILNSNMRFIYLYIYIFHLLGNRFFTYFTWGAVQEWQSILECFDLFNEK